MGRLSKPDGHTNHLGGHELDGGSEWAMTGRDRKGGEEQVVSDLMIKSNNDDACQPYEHVRQVNKPPGQSY